MLDYWLTPPGRATHRSGDEVDVEAWWTRPEGQTVRCRVEVVHDREPPVYYTVRPIAGANPHRRYVKGTLCRAVTHDHD